MVRGVKRASTALASLPLDQAVFKAVEKGGLAKLVQTKSVNASTFKPITEAVSAVMSTHGNSAKAASMKSYMKDLFEAHGLPSAEVKKVYREVKKAAKNTPSFSPAHFFHLASAFGQTQYFEEKILSTSLLQDSLPHFLAIADRDEGEEGGEKEVRGSNKGRKGRGKSEAASASTPNPGISELEDYIDDLIYGWAPADSVAGGFCHAALSKNEEYFGRLFEKWAGGSGESGQKCPTLWRRRIANVAYVKHANRGLYFDRALAIADLSLSSEDRDERFLQLGVGWCIRNYTAPAFSPSSSKRGESEGNEANDDGEEEEEEGSERGAARKRGGQHMKRKRQAAPAGAKTSKKKKEEDSMEARAVEFIEANLSRFSSEGLRYAVEKLSPDEQKRMREKRKEALSGKIEE